MSGVDDEDGGFLRRWARRKRRVQQSASDAPVSDSGDAGPSAEIELPSLEDVLPGGDLGPFMRAHVPDALRNAALRKMWSTDPEISGFIEMADYQWDFNNPDGIPGWGSAIDRADVERLIGRILDAAQNPGDSRKTDTTLDGPAAPSETQQPSSMEKIAFSAEPAQTLLPDAPMIGTENVAVQNNDGATAGYLPSRKRHGGALPT